MSVARIAVLLLAAALRFPAELAAVKRAYGVDLAGLETQFRDSCKKR